MKKPRLNSLGATAVAVALGLTLVAGCSDDDDDDDAPMSSPSSSMAGDSESPGATGSGTDLATASFTVDWRSAVQTAQKGFDGQLSEVGMDAEHRQPAYEVELVSQTEEYSVRIDAESGRPSGERTERLDSDDVAEAQQEVVDPDAVVSWDDALKTAQRARSGPVVEWKLEGTDRGPRYQFDISTGTGEDTEVTIDATSGKLDTVDD